MTSNLFKKILLFNSLIYLGHLLNGQTTTSSQPLEFHRELPPSVNHMMEPIDGNSFLMYDRNAKSAQIVKFNQDLKKEYEIDVSSLVYTKALISLYGIDLTERSYYPYVLYNANEDQIHFFQFFSKNKHIRGVHSFYDQKNGNFLKSEILIDTVLKKDEFPNLAFSKDRTAYAFCSSFGTKNPIVQLYSMNGERTAVWNPKLSKFKYIEDVLIVDSKTAYILIYDDKQLSYDLHILRPNHEDKIINIPVESDGRTIVGNLVSLSESNLAIIVQERSKKGLHSLKRIDIDLSLSKSYSNSTPELNSKYIKQLYSKLSPENGIENKAKYAAPKKPSYTLKSTIIEGNSIYTVLENNVELSSSDPKVLPRYAGGDILIAAFDEDGKNDWNQVIARRRIMGVPFLLKWSSISSSAYIYENQLKIIVPERHSGQHKLIERTLSLEDGTYGAPKDLFSSIDEDISYNAHFYCDLEAGRVHYTFTFPFTMVLVQLPDDGKLTIFK